ncbi:monocyte differentiation antigen CD14 [Rhineura floridana]|uniref:monocyte differentiation antigen CD14 n=1 Tax=Rhineura floridana TaxID=261503 RepID=UPI002AC81E24|nr:monocyte differentiation antigen CD14 [Rhineura floridana]XP_061442675.1 monocyte differentiation antigen CD14 [Rhineura floridana]XP_061442684.1 monocyte differentiation antigen CD14 [Rhineura floridana]XP_061442690.1 monocyte differentiation antigen CD14 [Rhineura floridana]XP_061442698.1 monocyte differentiation antigen CD14 [Rhineura floridana]
MFRTQAFMFFFLLELKLPKAKGNCNFIEPQSHCVCSLLESTGMKNFIQCLPAATYELREGNLEEFAGFAGIKPDERIVEILKALQVRKLIFTDLFVPENILPSAMEFVSYAPLVSELEFVNCTFLRTSQWPPTGRLNMQVSSLRFHKVTAAPLDDRLDMAQLKRWLKILQNLTVTESQVTSIPCKIGKMFTALHFLDVSGNHFHDRSMESSFCEGVFPQLQVLKLHHNNLTSYETVCKTIGHLKMLTHLDLSQNGFLPRDFSSSCMWPHSLHVFNLSNTGLEHIDRSLPPNIEILDLSANNIFTLDLSLPGLKELYLSNNSLQTVPSLSRLPHLEVLNLDQNQISELPSKGLKHLHSLKAGHNLYNCSCSHHIREIQDLAAKPSLLPDWPQDYICKSPPHYQDFLVKDVPLSSLLCNKALVSHGSIVNLLISLYLIFCWLPVPPFSDTSFHQL